MNETIYLSDIRQNEHRAVNDFTNGALQSFAYLIESVKLYHNSPERKENVWTGIAVKFKPNLPIEHIVAFTVRLKADEYSGKFEGYDLFWLD